MTKETLKNECSFGYKKTTSSKVCTVTYPEFFICFIATIARQKSK